MNLVYPLKLHELLKLLLSVDTGLIVLRGTILKIPCVNDICKSVHWAVHLVLHSDPARPFDSLWACVHRWSPLFFGGFCNMVHT